MATSTNTHDWTLTSPLITPHYFLLMECPIIRQVGNSYYLFINIDKSWIADDAPASVERFTGTHLLKADTLLGPYTYQKCLLNGNIDLNGKSAWHKYQLFPIHINPTSQKARCVHWNGYQEDGHFEGGLSEPYEISLI